MSNTTLTTRPQRIDFIAKGMRIVSPKTGEVDVVASVKPVKPGGRKVWQLTCESGDTFVRNISGTKFDVVLLDDFVPTTTAEAIAMGDGTKVRATYRTGITHNRVIGVQDMGSWQKVWLRSNRPNGHGYWYGEDAILTPIVSKSKGSK